jgi:dolichol-phosphate mannosyltransferase
MSTPAPSVWIVVPTLNEASNIQPLLERIRNSMAGLGHVICIVDDGSNDGTLNVVRDFIRANKADNIFIIQRKKTHWGSQRGVAVWTGLRFGLQHSACQIFVEMDADLSHRPEELRNGVEAICNSGYNVAIASKYLNGSNVINRPLGRRLLSRAANTTVRTLMSGRVRDYSNGYRFYDRECVGMICAHRLRYGSPIYLTEVLALLMAHRMRVYEFPSTYVGRGEGLSKLRIIDLVKASIAVVDIAMRFHFHSHGFVRGVPAYSAAVQISHVEPAPQPETHIK